MNATRNSGCSLICRTCFQHVGSCFASRPKACIVFQTGSLNYSTIAARNTVDEARLSTSRTVANRETILAQPRRTERHAGISRLAGTRISRRRGRADGRRSFAPQFPQADGRLDGAGRFRIEQLSQTRDASGALYEERGMGHSGQAALLCHRDAAASRCDAAGRLDGGRSPDQDRRQPAPSR